MQDEVIAKHREEYRVAWAQAVNRYLGEFIPLFCNKDGTINWEALVQFNSSKSSKLR
jgi:hypothetical protein